MKESKGPLVFHGKVPQVTQRSVVTGLDEDQLIRDVHTTLPGRFDRIMFDASWSSFYCKLPTAFKDGAI